MSISRRNMQWRQTSGTRREDALGKRFLLCCEVRCWKLVKAALQIRITFLFPATFSMFRQMLKPPKCGVLRPNSDRFLQKSGSTLPAPRPRPSVSTALTSAPAARSRSTVASWPCAAASCNGVRPRALEGKTR